MAVFSSVSFHFRGWPGIMLCICVFTGITCDIKARGPCSSRVLDRPLTWILKSVFLPWMTTQHMATLANWRDLCRPTLTPTSRPQTLTNVQALKAPYVAASLSDQEIINDFRCPIAPGSRRRCCPRSWLLRYLRRYQCYRRIPSFTQHFRYHLASRGRYIRR